MIRHVSSIAEIVEDFGAAVHFYRDVLGFTFEYKPDEGYALIELPGCLHFALWSRRAAAEATFDDAARAIEIPLGFTIGFEVDEVAATEQAMKNQGWQFVQPTKKEEWGQITARFLSPSGALCEIAETTWARTLVHNVEAAGEEQ